MGGTSVEVRAGAVRVAEVQLVAWLTMAVAIDPLLVVHAGASWAIVLSIRGLGAAVLLGTRLAIVRVDARGALALSALAGALTCAGAGVLGATLRAPAYDMTPMLWWLAMICFASPRARVAVAIGASWLAAYVIGAAPETRWPELVTVAAVDAGALLLAARVSHRLWELRHNLGEARRLAHYRLLSPIGHGGMNDVWLAWDETRRREVALKLLHTPGAAAKTRRQFEREAELVRLVKSPHTVRIHDYGASDDGFAYIALEYLRGMDLDALVRTFGPLEPRRAFRVMRQACRGLGDAHTAGIIHRDIKPANLHISDASGSEDFVRILDFGVARTVEDTAPPADGAVIGTPAYMSPEAFRGRDLSPVSDVYSLGATFYFALTGAPPIDADSAGAFQQAHERAPIVPPSLRAGVDIPRAVEKVVLRCLAKQPSDRYADAVAVAAALDAAVDVGEPWTREDAARWWHGARVGRVPTVVSGAEHTTDLAVARIPR